MCVQFIGYRGTFGICSLDNHIIKITLHYPEPGHQVIQIWTLGIKHNLFDQTTFGAELMATFGITKFYSTSSFTIPHAWTSFKIISFSSWTIELPILIWMSHVFITNSEYDMHERWHILAHIRHISVTHFSILHSDNLKNDAAWKSKP